MVLASRLMLLQEQATKYPNVTLHTAYMPEIFGTHHTKVSVSIFSSQEYYRRY